MFAGLPFKLVIVIGTDLPPSVSIVVLLPDWIASIDDVVVWPKVSTVPAFAVDTCANRKRRAAAEAVRILPSRDLMIEQNLSR
jgi:hypothetical protein